MMSTCHACSGVGYHEFGCPESDDADPAPAPSSPGTRAQIGREVRELLSPSASRGPRLPIGRAENLPRPTRAQRRILGAAAGHRLGRVVGADPRTRDLMIFRGWIEPDGYGRSGDLVFRIAEAGRSALASR